MRHTFLRRLMEMRAEAPIVYWALVACFLAEAGAALLGPFFVPAHIYLQSYMSDKAKANLVDFYTGKSSALVFDEHCGWRSTPNFAHGSWVIDQFGARSSGPITALPGKKKRILFLGSSLINGGNKVDNLQTISAAIEDSLTEALNMGTMLYSIDQSLLLYTSRLREFGSDVVVVGLSGDATEGLTARFVPFYRRSESSMPYFKPRFVEQAGVLKLLPVPAPDICRGVLASDVELRSLRDTDGYYGAFSGYCRFGMTPIADSVWHVASRARNLLLLMKKDKPGLDLLLPLMHRLEGEVTQDGARVIFLLLPNLKIVSPGWRAHLPDQYGGMVDRMRAENFTVLDGRRLLVESNQECRKLYSPDHEHYTPLGNRIIAAGLKPLL